MILEAPFDVELRDGLTAYLHSGRVTVRCPSSAHGFTVLTLMARSWTAAPSSAWT